MVVSAFNSEKKPDTSWLSVIEFEVSILCVTGVLILEIQNRLHVFLLKNDQSLILSK